MRVSTRYLMRAADAAIRDETMQHATQTSGRGSVETEVTAVVLAIAAQHEVRTEISLEASLVDSGMTSMAMVDLMLAIEAAFDVTIPQRELTPANFRSIESLATLVARL